MNGLDKLSNLWDNLDQTSREEASEITPFWAIDYEKDATVVEWTKKVMPALKELIRPFKDKCLDNLDFYKGKQGLPEGYIPRNQDRTTLNKSRDIVINLCYEFTDIWTNRMSQYKPAIQISPANMDFSDRQAAEMAQDWVDYIEEVNAWEALIHKAQLWSFIFGESYLYTFWDAAKGDVHPEYKKAQKEGKKIPVAGVANEDGDPLYIENEIKVGEVSHKLLFPWRVLFPDVEDLDEADWCIMESEVDIEELKAQYPKKNLTFTDSELGFLSDEVQDVPRKGKIRVYELYHRSTNKISSGRYVKFVYGEVLENIRHPYSHKGLPINRLTNIDVPGDFRGRSFLEGIKSLQVMYNKITGVFWRNIALAAHPKWMVQAGSTRVESLGNSMTVVEYEGGIAPQLATFPVVPADVFNFRKSLRDEALTAALLQGVSVGVPPPNIRSGLQFSQLEEQQQRAVNFLIVKRNKFIESLARISLGVAGDYYDAEDGRTLRIMGKSKEPLIKALDVVKLSSQFDIRVANNSGMPEGKFGKLDLLIQLRQVFGAGVVPDEVAMDAFEMGKPEQYVNYATASVEKAESENEEMLNEILPYPPQPFDDHIVEWRVHVAAMRQRSFSDVPDEVKALYRMHLEATERLMEQKANINNLFAQKLSTLDGFPIYWELESPLPQIDPNTGLPIPPPMPEEGLLPEAPIEPQVDPVTGMPMEAPMLPEVLPPMGEVLPPVSQPAQVQINLTMGSGEVKLTPEINPETGNREWTIKDEVY